jgi:hypothetical protein
LKYIYLKFFVETSNDSLLGTEGVSDKLCNSGG